MYVYITKEMSDNGYTIINSQCCYTCKHHWVDKEGYYFCEICNNENVVPLGMCKKYVKLPELSLLQIGNDLKEKING